MTLTIPTSMLRSDDLPHARDWASIEMFALTYDGCAQWGDGVAVAVAARRVEVFLEAHRLELATEDELRAFLFFEQRAWRQQGDAPTNLRPHMEVVEALRERLASRPSVPPASVDSEAMPSNWFGAMVDGLVRHKELLFAVSARVAPEAVAVAAMANALARFLPDHAVDLEATSHGIKRIDMLVRDAREGAEPEQWAFECKALWANGLGECVKGLKKDMAKLAKHSRGSVLAFAYAIHGPRDIATGRRTEEPLELTVRKAVERIGRRPAMLSAVQPFEGGQFEVQLLVWPNEA
jgi:hypothetical protein